MPVYKNGSKVESLYHNGNKIKKAFYFGNLVYQIKKALAGVTSTGKDLIIHTTRVIYTSTRDYSNPDPDTGAPTVTEEKKPLGKQVTIPTAKDSYNNYDDENKYYTSWNPGLEITTNTYPTAHMKYIMGFGEEYINQKEGDSAYKTMRSEYSQGIYGFGVDEVERKLNMANIAWDSQITTGYWDFNFTLTVTPYYNYSSYASVDVIRVDIVEPEAYGGSVIHSYSINETINGPKTWTWYALQLYMQGGSSSNNYIYNVNLYYKNHTGDATLGHDGTSKFTAKTRCRTVTYEYHYDEDMVLEAEETTYIFDEGDQDSQLRLSLTPASEYDPINGHGIANVKVSEDGDVYDIVEFA